VMALKPGAKLGCGATLLGARGGINVRACPRRLSRRDLSLGLPNYTMAATYTMVGRADRSGGGLSFYLWLRDRV